MTPTSPAAPPVEPGGLPSDPDSRYPLGGMPRFGPMLAIIWVVFLVEPFQASFDAPTALLRAVGVVGVLGVATIFALTFLRYRRRPALRPRAAVLLLVVQVVCVALSCLAAQQHGLVGLVFVCVTAIYLVPGRVALVIVGASVVVMVVLPRVLPGWQTEDGNVVGALLASAAVYGFTQVIERNRRLREAQQQVADLAVARERERIARDMHDVLGHSLTVISVKAELAAKLLASAGPEGAASSPTARAAAEVADIQDLARGALADVRGTVAGARRVTLAGELAATRSALDAAGVAAELPGAVDAVPADRRELFAWVLREGTTNVVRHARASRVVVTLTPGSLVVEDDGRGVPGPREEGGGRGLIGLAARARQAGAVLETGPSALGGFRIAVTARDDASPAGARIDP
ncbi:sensor histidine kinase [Krasilnikoviella flava]|uniref:sensor histidine kinase n=1 Tax=Krasilnikoviella flava TaxID=526729 RepID=UPI00111BDD73|nr:histidine kinase [Krasilnikoviella flava]